MGKHKHGIIINPGLQVAEESPVTAEEIPVTAAAELPRNLRPRNRTVAPETKENNKKEVSVDEKRNLIRPKMAKKNEPLLKLAVPLSKSEIALDFFNMTGKKPPSRPKRRPRPVQRDVELTTYLGLSLAEIPRDRYEVPESPPYTNKVKGISEDK